MSNPDYYDILGIPRDAGPAEIKRGFRVARSAAHPDRHGGSDDAMALVNRAHDCLTDPERRAIYDATGVDQPQGDEVRQLMETLLNQQAEQMLREGFEANLNCEDDRRLLKNIREGLKQGIHAATGHRDSARKKIAMLSKRLGRITVKEGQRNLVEELLTKKLADAEEQAEGAEHDIAVMRAATKLLENYGTTQPNPEAVKPAAGTMFRSQPMHPFARDVIGDFRFFGGDR